MQIDVYDTRVRAPDGRELHFDVLVPAGARTAREHARRWLSERGIEAERLDAARCRFCHSEVADPELAEAIRQQGFVVVTLNAAAEVAA